MLPVLLTQLRTDGLEKIDRHRRVLFDEGIETLSGHSQECRWRHRRDAAERGLSSSSAISPKNSPGPISRITCRSPFWNVLLICT